VTRQTPLDWGVRTTSRRSSFPDWRREGQLALDLNLNLSLLRERMAVGQPEDEGLWASSGGSDVVGLNWLFGVNPEVVGGLGE